MMNMVSSEMLIYGMDRKKIEYKSKFSSVGANGPGRKVYRTSKITIASSPFDKFATSL
jgi:hypothetical protein